MVLSLTSNPILISDHCRDFDQNRFELKAISFNINAPSVKHRGGTLGGEKKSSLKGERNR